MVSNAFSKLLIFIIRIYQKILSPYLGGNCRFYPSCSEYAVQAISKYGPLRGTAKGAWRLLRCNPFSKGGIDYP
jgi:putative membrane protein insertion efficiency factor